MHTALFKPLGFTLLIAATPAAFAQTGHFARWEVLLDNGATWASGQVTAPASQPVHWFACNGST
jgi:hypothetical protein